VIGWADQGHQITGYIAQKLLNPEVANRVAKIIQEPAYHGQLTDLAPWADYAKYPWSKELHFANTHDNPPDTCHVDYDHDCLGDRCVMGAIVNYTRRLDCGSDLDAFQRDEALKFLTHFMGDITQPLHVSGKMGGVRTKARFKKNKRTTLHIVWDLLILKKRTREDFHDDFKLYAEFLLDKIRNEYAHEVGSWYACNVNDLPGLLKCVLPWSVESNAMNCEFVWHYSEDEALEDRYYQESKPIVDKSLAEAGYRLARLLNELLSKSGC
ncbi:19295_t:CDS:2, partial [Funneliformis geosporum]